MISSASAQIEASQYSFSGCAVITDIICCLAGGQHVMTTINTPSGPKVVPDYALIQGVFIGCVSTYVIVLALIGPENHGRHFENSKAAFQADASREDVGSARERDIQDIDESSVGSAGGKEKGDIQLAETKGPKGVSYV